MERFESPAQNVTLFVVHAVGLADGRPVAPAGCWTRAGGQRSPLWGRHSASVVRAGLPELTLVCLSALDGVGRGGFLD